MKKNEIIELDIIDTTLDGYGVGKHGGITVFVKSAVTGDKIKAHVLSVKTSHAFAKIDKIVVPSNDRCDNDCFSYPRCGGCSFRHITYDKELKIKESSVYNNFKRIGDCEPVLEKIYSLNCCEYRNKAQYPIENLNGEIKIGFFANHSHRVIDCPFCHLQCKEFSDVVNMFREFIVNNNISCYNNETKQGLVRHLYLRKAVATGDVMVAIVINGSNLPFCDELLINLKSIFGSKLKSFVLNINCDVTNVILGNKNINIYGNGYITDILCGVKIRISPLSFYQINHNIAEKLYEKVAEYAEPNDKFVLDLYCGAGTIGLSLANKAKKVIGVEIVPDAVNDAKFNALQNNISNAEFICADASYAANELNKNNVKPDVIIIDPPRKGCSDELINIISNNFSPKRVVYVSCDSATLARDCKIFKSYGYETIKAAPFDMFPRTSHVETVALLCRDN